MPIDSTHPDYDKYKCQYKDIRDALENQYECHVIKPLYTTDPRSAWHNQQYIKRAVFCNFVYGTKETLVGLATQKDMIVELPSTMEYLKEDCTNDHISLELLRRRVVGEVAMMGRYILLTDYPPVSVGLSEEARLQLNPQPKIFCYKAEDLDNWDVDESYGSVRLTYLKLKDEVKQRRDGHEWCNTTQYKVLSLDQNGYYNWQQFDSNGKALTEPQYPRMNGKLMTYIPIDVIGSQDNNICPDAPPGWRFAHVNFGHLRNSATYESNLHTHGGSTMFITSSMSASEWKNMYGDKPIQMGSPVAHYLGQTGDAKLVQCASAPEIANAMKHKEEMLYAMGASMIMQASSNSPVETAQLNMGSKTSPLVNYVKNFEQALRSQLHNCARFLAVDENLIELEVPKDFIPKNADSAIMAQLMTQYIGGVLPKSVVREYDRGVDLIPDSMSDEDLDAEISNEPPLTDNTSNTNNFSGNNDKQG